MSNPTYIILSDSDDEISNPFNQTHVEHSLDFEATYPTKTEDESSYDTERMEINPEEDPEETHLETPTTPPPTVAAFSPHIYDPLRMLRPRTRTTARKSVRLPRLELTEPIDETRIFHTDIYGDTTAPAPVPIILISSEDADSPTPSTDSSYTSRRERSRSPNRAPTDH
jgi:hypothetical protein